MKTMFRPRADWILSLAFIGALSIASASTSIEPFEHTQASAIQDGAAAATAPDPRASEGLDLTQLRHLDEVIDEAIQQKKLPGAVVLVGRHGRVVYEKAYGNRALLPAVERMTLDTIFDLASLTKVVATTTSVMILVDEGRLRLTDRVAVYIPEFDRNNKGDITLRDLLTHYSGLRPDLDLRETFTGYEAAIARAADEVPVARPGERFIYSDINFFVLGEVVARTTGMRLDQFAHARIFEPLGMRDTLFNPPASYARRIAPTEACSPMDWPCGGATAKILRGVVHDPTSRRMGGVAGHAGLFSTARDLAIFCRMVLSGGSVNGTRILSPLAVSRMTSPATPGGVPDTRGLGWDIDSMYSSNRGELFPIGSFGHTGFTGTSLWLDPATDTFVIFLSNRVHPDGKGDVTPLRNRVATVVASAITDFDRGATPGSRFTSASIGPTGSLPPRAIEPVMTGIDVLQAEAFSRLRGQRVGLLTNQAGRSRNLQPTIDLLHQADGVQLVALFSPEHGIRGTLDDQVPSSRDEKTGLPIHSLYSETRRPTAEMLAGIDTILIDLQDIGTRFYTYMTTMGYVMEEAARHHIPVVVLDRPNPINGFQVEGPALDRALLGFTGYFPMPIRHGLTIGELARLFNAENKIGSDLTIVAMKGWRRDEWFDETGLPWSNPSPNMRSLLEATLYPGIGAIEGSNISVGRGTGTPFEQVGAPWIDGVWLAAELNARKLAGIRFYPVTFTPSSSTYAGEACQGVFMVVTDRLTVSPVRVGLEIAAALHRRYGKQFQLERTEKLLGSADVVRRIRAGEEPQQIADSWAPDEERWRRLRGTYLLYR